MNMITKLTDIARSPGDPEVLSKGANVRAQSDRLARGLGWFSIGLGLAELLAARRMASALGMDGKEMLVRAYGAREIAAGVMSLWMTPRPGVASRVVGDLLDVATLLAARRPDNAKRKNVDFALAAVLGAAILDIACTKACGRSTAAGRMPPATIATVAGYLSGSRPHAAWRARTPRFRATCARTPRPARRPGQC